MKRKIIIVDDNARFRNTLKDILHHIGEVDVIAMASNGMEFLELLIADYKPDIVFIDIKMPRMDGITSIKHALKIQANLVIIGISMYSDQSYINNLRDAGAKGYLFKTGDNLQLLKQIIKEPNKNWFISTENK